MNRNDMLDRVADRQAAWDVVIIGGGATGVGVAVDAANRGYATLLIEQSDFGKATSSRSTKLAHGGVRYLQQGSLRLVREALKERGVLRQNAPHLVHALRFIVPSYHWWQRPYYAAGLRFYDLLAGKHSFGKSAGISKSTTQAHLPTVKSQGLRSGIQYFDGQFDDARLLISLVRTAADQGAIVLNYAPALALLKNAGNRLDGVRFTDAESGRQYDVKAKVVVNATGAFTDDVVRMDDPQAAKMIAPSQGVHVVLPKSFLPGDSAIMVPHTRDGRVMFAIPWHDHVLLGTTDTPVAAASLEPHALDQEIDFLLATASDYLQQAPTRSDITSVFAGIRPLVKSGSTKNTAKLSREHTIAVSQSGLVSICGGKWTTYRRMAEDCVNRASEVGGLDSRPCGTMNLKLHGFTQANDDPQHLRVYGSDAAEIARWTASDPALAQPIHASFPHRAVEVVWAVRHEMARAVDDVLSRRTRMLQLNAQAAAEAAGPVAKLMADQLGEDAAWQQDQTQRFQAIASGYQCHFSI